MQGRTTSHMPCWQEPVYVNPGQTLEVRIGGSGRPVTGRVVLGGVPESPVDWKNNEPALIEGATQFAANLDQEGRFRIEDVPAGQYGLEVPVNAPADTRFGGIGIVIGKAQVGFTVPAMPGGRSNEPLDLGTITAKLFDNLKIGDLAPDFNVERIGGAEKGSRLKLSDYRGKLVLLHFWNTWDVRIDMIVVKEVQEAFGRDPRFALISLARDNDAGAGRTVHQGECARLDARPRRLEIRRWRTLQDSRVPERSAQRSRSANSKDSAHVSDRSRWANPRARPDGRRVGGRAQSSRR